ncbi:MAG TPA: hypothetical protein VHE55_05325 [Fimbriimonadaceae bacterium]|nr:hypothetical protein [Fimbriimonadaceae bacterium]
MRKSLFLFLLVLWLLPAAAMARVPAWLPFGAASFGKPWITRDSAGKPVVITQFQAQDAARSKTPMLTTWIQLTDGGIETYREVSLDAAGNLNLTLGFGTANVGFGKARRVLVREFTRYVTTEVGGKKLRVGAGIRMVVDIISNKGDTESNLAILAAKANLNEAQVSVTVEKIGVSNSAIDNALNIPSGLTVESYVKINDGWEAAKKLFTDSLSVSPQIVEVYDDAPAIPNEDLFASLASTWALWKIENGKSLQQALADLPTGLKGIAVVDAKVREVYTLIGEVDSETATPGPVPRAKAKELRSGLRIG